MFGIVRWIRKSQLDALEGSKGLTIWHSHGIGKVKQVDNKTLIIKSGVSRRLLQLL
jgi:hypothetical protein